MKNRTYEEILAIASNFKSLTEWRQGYQSSYVFACKQDWQRKIASALGWTPYRPVTRKRDYDECKQLAEKYSSLNEWQKSHRQSYLCACRQGWQKNIAEELGWAIQFSQKRTYAQCLKSARRFSSRKEWIEKDYTVYRYAHKRDWDKKIVKSLRWKTIVDRKERESPLSGINDCLPFAAKFDSLLEWQKGHRRSYSFAVRNRFQRDIARQLNWKPKRWGGENI